ncbi:MAG: ankyrin repeat domain-containing protein [Planctomycetota bacterium]
MEVARWAIERGTDIHAIDTWGGTALHESARSRFNHALTVEQLLELGANVHKTSNEGLTPLHSAVDGKHLKAIVALLENGANVHTQSTSGLTPLEHGLQRMSNIDLVDMVPVVSTLLDAGADMTEEAKEIVRRASETFEFHREGFNRDSVFETSEAALRLCELASVQPQQRRHMHDGTSPILPNPGTAAEQFAELWELLVPSSVPSETIQGEVIRIAGRVHGEWMRNGGANWDRDYASMALAFTRYIGLNHALDDQKIEACKAIVKSIKTNPDAYERMHLWAVEWVKLNPEPIRLTTPKYSR